MESSNNQEREIELERAKTERLNAERAAVEAQERLGEQQRLERSQQEEKVLRDIINDGPKSHLSPQDLIKLLRSDGEYGLEVDGDKATAVYEGKKIPLAQFLEKLVESKPYLFDGRAVRAVQQRKAGEQDKSPAKARSEMTMAEKIAFLDQPDGLAKWEKLPAYPTKMVPLSELTLQQFSKLPVSEKTRLISQNPNLVEELARRGRR